MELSQRKDRILASVVSGYISTGEPVGSKAIAAKIGVSSATVRNEMAGLTELGLLEQPHTSSGRVPSQRGYREFVDRLMRAIELSETERGAIDGALGLESFDPGRILSLAARLLSSISGCASAVTTPGGEGAVVRAVQLVQTGRRTAMLLMMSSAGTVKSRMFRCDYDLTGDILRLFFRVFNEKVTGKTVREISPGFVQGLGASLGELYSMVGAPLRALIQAAQDTARTETILSGQMNLLRYPELEPEGARGVLDLMERREAMAPLLSQKPGRVTAIIGRECGWPQLEQTAVLVARYSVNAQDAGAMALVGPVRMDYQRLTALLKYTSSRVSSQLAGLED